MATAGQTVPTRARTRAPRPRGQPSRARLELAPQPPPFDFLESSIQAPKPRPGAVSRRALVNRLRAATASRVASIEAPAGYGKTTLLSQWAERDPRRFAWVSIDERDNDPLVLLQHVAASLADAQVLEPRLLDALRSPRSIWSAAVPRLAAALSAAGPTVLVLDDFHMLRSREALQAVSALIGDEDEGSMLLLAGRSRPRLPLAALRADGDLFELGASDLALTLREAHLLVRAMEVSPSEKQTADLVERCEGWAAGLSLGSRSIQEGRETGREVARVRGDDRYLAEYFRSEYLSQLRPGPLRFLRRTSVLERLCGPLCDAVLGEAGSARELERIQRANVFLVPLDNRGRWYRYHPLFRDLLRRELAADDPDLVPVLHRRAADWFAARGEYEPALEHAFAAGDIDRAAATFAKVAIGFYDEGRIATLERWLSHFSRAGLVDGHPEVALHGCRIDLLRGRPERAAAWLAAAERAPAKCVLPDGSKSTRAWIAVIRAWMCRGGAEQMLADAEAAIAGLPTKSNWLPSALLAQGSALALLGQNEPAAEALTAAAACAAFQGSIETKIVALGQRALLAADNEDFAAADELTTEAARLLADREVRGYPATGITRAAEAQLLFRHGRWNEARAALTAAQELLPFLNAGIPWLAARVRIEVAQGLLTLRDGDAARELLDETEQMLRGLPDLGALSARVRKLRLEVDAVPEDDAGRAAGLTPAELRLLPLLATHLSFREIADQLHVSRNTIKTQAISVYRKLAVSSRSEAITEAHRLGLGDRLSIVISNSA